MCITNKRDLNFPEEILIGEIAVKVVDKFKLLGVTIDNNMLNLVPTCENMCTLNSTALKEYFIFLLP